MLTLDSVTLTEFWVHASPASNRFFLKETGSLGLASSVAGGLAVLALLCNNKCEPLWMFMAVLWFRYRYYA